MRTLQLPGSSVAVTRIGLGCARLYAGPELKMSAKLIECALDHGIRHFDTAPSYGVGASEEVLGQVLSGEKGVTIATKVGFRGTNATQRPLGSLYRRTLRPLLTMAPGLKPSLLGLRARLRKTRLDAAPLSRQSLLPDQIHASLESSLRRLRRERVDLLLLHEPEHMDWPPETVEALENLVKSGVIGGFGLAYGGYSDGRALGGVTQSRFGDQSLDLGSIDQVHLVHGVLRLGPSNAEHRTASEKIASALLLGPKVGVVFSASSAQQIGEVMSGAAGAVVAQNFQNTSL